MSFSVDPRRAIWIAGAVAALVYVGAVGNEWVLDDVGIIENNPTAHSPAAAARGLFSTYWPAEQGAAGLYRPAVIFSYAVDWMVGGGRPSWFHAVNILLHAVATAMVVAIALAWLRAPWALIAGLVFAVHPVHVEAVANVVGRAEVLTAVCLLGAVLSARRYRRAAGHRRVGWGLATVGAIALGLLTKEHAVVGIALLALDEWLESDGGWRRSVPLYAGVGAVSVAWFAVWYAIAGSYVAGTGGAGVHGLALGHRLTTMLPAQLDVIRLLVWPMDLTSDYSPLVIPQRLAWSGLAVLGLCLVIAVLGIGFASVRRAPPVAFGILVAVVTYAPTSNFVFTSGITLGERNLYLAVLAPALVLAWVGANAGARRRLALAVMAVLGAGYVVRIVTRVPVWHDSVSVIVADLGAHPENYRAHVRLASLLMGIGDAAGSVAELGVAASLFPEDPYVALGAVPRARALGRTRWALAEARRTYLLRPDDARLARLYVQTLLDVGRIDDALAVARTAVTDHPSDSLHADVYRELLETLNAPTWARDGARAEVAYRRGMLIEVSAAIARATAQPVEPDLETRWCWDLRHINALSSAFSSSNVDVFTSLCSGSQA